MTLQPAQVIVLATPVFFVLIAIEWWVGHRRGKPSYRVNDAIASVGLGIFSQLTGLFTKLFALGLYAWVWEHWAFWQLPDNALWVWLSGLLLYDFCYYWLHRAGHTVAFFWAAHVVHHQSEEYNLSTALRQTSSGWLGSWLFYLPLALLGYSPLVFVTVGLIDLLYQFWVHTRQIDRLGWFDRWLCSPSNHRVHHAVNDRYLDRNYGGILMVWDRLFGSFTPEDNVEPIVYGTRKPLRSWNPLWANLEVYAALWHDSRHAASWADKLRVWFKPPGWRPADVAARFPGAPFELQRPLYDPPVSRGALWASAALFVAAVLLTSVLLWTAHEQASGVLWGGAAGVLVCLVLAGRCLGRPLDESAQASRSPVAKGA
ncbi:hypothetical protein GCM10009107_61580 [Ideonella azotifigens]|uniref:Fatty acid hydroxylase domain-containing protein n=1 Tax=Ideonella azotifigens TaxID=513160 RepID=A0ABP3VUP0_9BURK